MGLEISGGGLAFEADMETNKFDAKVKKVEDDLAKISKQAAQGSTAQTAAMQSLNKEYAVQDGLLGRLKEKLKELKAEAASSKSLLGIEKANIEIQLLEKEIKRLSNIGKVGWSDTGEKIKDAIDKPMGVTISRLQQVAEVARQGISKVSNPEALANLNRKLELTEKQIKKMSSIGKEGFDSIGNSAAKNSNFFTKAFSGLKTIAAILPGIGVAGAAAFIAEPVLNYVASLDIFGTKLKVLSEQLKAYNDVNRAANKDAGKQITDLKILYKAATDVTNSIKARTDAARELQKEFPAAFASSKISAILNGEESKSYRQLTKDIFANAQARASVAKIEELTAKRLDAEFQKQKITNANANEKNRIKGSIRLNTGGDSKDLQSNAVITVDEQKADADKRARAAFDVQDKVLKSVDSQIAFLTKMAGGNNKLAEVSGDGDGGKAAQNASKKAAALLKAQQHADDLSLKAKEALQQRISDIEDKYSRKSLTKDEAEIAAVRKEFEMIAIEVQRFNANPKNKLHQVDEKSLDKTREAAIADLKARQQLERDKLTFDTQKQLYASYETYKTEYGQAEADRRFKGQIGKEKTFIDYLKSLVPKESDVSAYANTLRDYLAKEIPEAQNDALKQAFADNLSHLKSIEDATKNSVAAKAEIERRYNDDLATLDKNRAKYTDEEFALRVAKLAENKDLELSQVKQMAFQETGYYREALMNVTNLSLTELKKRISEARKELSNANLTPEQRAAATQKLNNAESGLSALGFSSDQYGQDIKAYSEIAERANKIAAFSHAIQSSFNELGNAISSVNPGLGDTLSTIGDIAGIAGTAAKSVESFATGDIVGGVQGAISVISSIFTMGAKARESARKAAEETKLYQDNVIKGEFALNQLLRERQRTLQNISDLSLKELQTRQLLLKSQASQAQQDFERLLRIIQASGQQVTGTHEKKSGGFLGIGRKTSTVQDTAGLAGMSYDELEKLYVKGALTDSTKAWFEQLQKAKAEIDAIGGSTDDVFAQINQIATGTTSNAIADALINGFKAGKRSAADFADDFKGLMQEAALSVFKSNFLNGRINDFYKEFAKASEGGLTADKIDQLKASYAKIIADSASKLSDLEKVTGSFSASTSGGANTLSGSIKKELTEETGTVISGAINGMRLVGIQHLEVGKQSLSVITDALRVQQQIEVNTRQLVLLSPILNEIKNNNTSVIIGLRAAGIIK